MWCAAWNPELALMCLLGLAQFVSPMESTEYASVGQSKNVHWTVTRPTNSLFTGREEVLERAKSGLCDSSSTPSIKQQRRFIITGLGGQGKSELCLKIADMVRERCVCGNYNCEL